ncbi:MAG TPA: AI-2E family transporter [Ktedonobacterales bacterium]|nr:AI-2E family transporter [Ktedonobacterales bacterium]
MSATLRPINAPAERPADERVWMRRLFIPLTLLAWGAVIAVVFWLLGLVAQTVILIALAVLIAYALTPVVSRLTRWLPRWLAIVVAYCIFGGALVLLIYIIAGTVSHEVSNLISSLQAAAKPGSSQHNGVRALLSRFGVSTSAINGLDQRLRAALPGVASHALPIVSSVANVLVGLVVTLVLSVYFLAAGPRIGQWMRTDTPLSQRHRITYFLDTVNRVVGGYIRGQVTLAALIGLLVGFGMYFLFHLPFAVLLGILAFVLEFIPFLGVIVSGVACVLVALTQGVVLAVLVLGYFVIVHVIEGDVVGPRIVGKAVGLHPALSLIALIAGTELFGIWGALFAAPVAGLIQSLVETFWTEYRGTHLDQFPTTVTVTPAGAATVRAPRRVRIRGIFFRRRPPTAAE